MPPEKTTTSPGGRRSTTKKPKPPTTVIVASRRGLVQAGMASLIRQLPQLRHLDTAQDGAAVARAIDSHRPDVMVLDQELALDVRDACIGRPTPRVLLLSSQDHVGMDPPCGPDCACGLVPDRAPTRHIRAALKIIGGCNSTRLGEGYCNSCPLRSSLRLPRLPLSAREYAVFERISMGETNLQIANHFGRSVKTIETHRENIKRKLGLENSGELVEAAIAWRSGRMPRPSSAA